MRSESLEKVASGLGAKVGNLGVNPLARCLIKSEREVGFASYLGEAIDFWGGTKWKMKKRKSKSLAK